MAIWNPNPTKTSCLVIDGGATIIAPKNKPFNNYSEIIIKNGTLKIESLEFYNNYEGKGYIRIGPIGRLIILDANAYDVLSLVSDCAVGSRIEVYNEDQTESTIYTLIERPEDHELVWINN